MPTKNISDLWLKRIIWIIVGSSAKFFPAYKNYYNDNLQYMLYIDP